MAPAKQQQLSEFSANIARYNIKLGDLSLVDKLRYIQKKSNLTNWLSKDVNSQEAFTRLLDYAGQFNGKPMDFFASSALNTDTDAYTHEVEKVSLMTMHASKGLEFSIVFIAGCEESLIPHRKPDSEENDIQEERRLLYVAMTRARERLYLTRAKKRKIHGRVFERKLSRFVSDIENHLKIDESPRPKEKKMDKGRHIQMKLF